MDEIRQGMHNGPQCRNIWVNSHCIAGHKYTCAIQQQCDCSSLPRPALLLHTMQSPQQLVTPQQQQQEQASVASGACTAAGHACCARALRSCPHPTSAAFCLAEARSGVFNGPGCGKNYIHGHCEAGNTAVCFEKEHCNCLALPEIRQVQRRRWSVSSLLQAAANRSSSRCTAAGRSCCRLASQRCPFPNSGDACLTEIHVGMQQGPNCRQNYIHSRCVADRMFSCHMQHSCDCSLQHEDGSMEMLYSTPPGSADNFLMPQTFGHSTMAVGATVASAALIVAIFGLLVALVTCSVRRRSCANSGTSVDKILNTDSEDDKPV